MADSEQKYDQFTSRSAPSPSLRRLWNASDLVLVEPKADELSFLASELVQVTLPHRSPGNVAVWSRTNGDLTLVIRPGWDAVRNQSLGYPCGSIPRLLLFWMTTEALRTRTHRLELGDTLASFMRDLGLDPSRGGPRSDARRLQEQMRRLFHANISFHRTQTRGEQVGEQWLNMAVTDRGELWWDRQSPLQSTLWGSWIELGSRFYDALIANPVPVDRRALKALKHSPLALDLYAWASYRTYRVTRAGKPAFIPWRALAQQLGTDYADVKDFKRRARRALAKVQAVYPALRYLTVRGGLELHPSRPAVLAR